jgi:hypothetical protein
MNNLQAKTRKTRKNEKGKEYEEWMNKQPSDVKLPWAQLVLSMIAFSQF